MPDPLAQTAASANSPVDPRQTDQYAATEPLQGPNVSTPSHAALSPEAYAADFTGSLLLHDMDRERSRMSDAHHLGVSDMGECREKARLTLLGTEPSEAPSRFTAMVGTAIDGWIKTARHAANPNLVTDATVTVTLPSGLVLLGHPDEIDPQEPSVTDYKTKDEAGLAYVARNGAQDTHRMGRNLYGLGAAQSGLVPREGLTVRNIYVDRSGRNPDPFVEQEPLDMGQVVAADAWYQDVLYAIEHGEQASKDKYFGWCERFCPFFSKCRLEDASPVGHYEDAEIVRAAAQHRESDEQIKLHELLKDGASQILHDSDVSGVAGPVKVRRSWTNYAGRKCKCGCGRTDGYHVVKTEAA